MRKSQGFTIIELLITISVLSIMVVGSVSQFSSLTFYAHDLAIKQQAREFARSTIEMITTDIYNAGSGMPLKQDEFSSANASLNDAPLLMLTTSNSSTLNLRVSEKGKSTYTTAAFNPTTSPVTIFVEDGNIFTTNHMAYVSTLTSGGEHGVQATISSTASNNIGLDNVKSSSTSNIEAGAIVTPVSNITWNSDTVNDEITRDNGTGVVTIAPDATFSLKYYALNGAEITTLTPIAVENGLTSVEVTANFKSQKKLRDGTYFQFSITSTIPLGNKIY